jgi:FlaA1/EpsC-like NDP-sugar epimerase
MLEVNILGADSFLASLRQYGHGAGGVFFVSTDKAARPASLMGASKRLMEMLLWAHTDERWLERMEITGVPPLKRVTSARFANVAFSDGSLTSSFLHRIDKGQALAAPGDIRRYLISPAEAGQLCLLGATVCPDKHLLVPRLDANKDVVAFTDIAEALLARIGFEAEWCSDPEAGRHKVSEAEVTRKYPVVVTKSDTDGEKEMEEFIAPDERCIECDLQSALAVEGGGVDFTALRALLDLVHNSVKSGCAPSKEYITDCFRQLVPDLAHRKSGRSLDVKM